jgi:hypothetical protein
LLCATINNTQDFGIARYLNNLPALRAHRLCRLQTVGCSMLLGRCGRQA